MRSFLRIPTYQRILKRVLVYQSLSRELISHLNVTTRTISPLKIRRIALQTAHWDWQDHKFIS